MESPAYLVEQFAKERGVSKMGAMRGMLMQTYAAEGRTLAQSVKALGIARSTATNIARKLMIDFPDYRPYAAKEKRGEARPAPYHRNPLPVDGLALFDAAA